MWKVKINEEEVEKEKKKKNSLVASLSLDSRRGRNLNKITKIKVETSQESRYPRIIFSFNLRLGIYFLSYPLSRISIFSRD